MKRKERFMTRASRVVPLVVFFILSMTTFAFAAENRFVGAWKGLILEWNTIISGVAGLGALTSMLVFIFHMFQLATVGSAHATTRRKILDNILVSGICTALLGGVGLIFGILYNTVFFG